MKIKILEIRNTLYSASVSYLCGISMFMFSKYRVSTAPTSIETNNESSKSFRNEK